MPLSASNEELQHFVKNKVLVGALEKDGGQADLSLWLLLGASMGILNSGPPDSWGWVTEGI